MSDLFAEGVYLGLDIAIEILADARNEFPEDLEKQRTHAFNEMLRERENWRCVLEKHRKEEREYK